jgi:hypothetical protein
VDKEGIFHRINGLGFVETRGFRLYGGRITSEQISACGEGGCLFTLSSCGYPVPYPQKNHVESVLDRRIKPSVNR